MKELPHPVEKQELITFSINLHLLKKILASKQYTSYEMKTLRHRFQILNQMSKEDMKELLNFLIKENGKNNTTPTASTEKKV